MKCSLAPSIRFSVPSFLGLLALLFTVLTTKAAEPASSDLQAQMERGRQVYMQHCFICHQLNGQGIPGAFPPLAKSDYLMSDKTRSIKVIVEGLSGEIVVNGKRYVGAMPSVLINDQQIADVLTYARNSWGNTGEPVTPQEVLAYRETTRFKTFEALAAAAQFPPLPNPPEGFALREVARMPDNPVRIASDGTGTMLYVLTGNGGDVWRVDIASGAMRQILKGSEYLEKRPDDVGGPIILVGMVMGKDRHLYIVSNQNNKATKPAQNIVTVYRTSSFKGKDPMEPKPWFQTNYHGNFAYLHGAEGMAFGPDGNLYIANGARTDANQTGGDSTEWYTGGEVEISSCIWKINTSQNPPTMEIFARGIRNGYGLAFNSQGELFESENGPDAHAPEELNHIQKGKHYGFPYRFGDWTRKAYSHTPDAPPGLEFELPIANLGPDGGYDGKPIYTFDPHSCPGGMTFLTDDFPEGWRGTLLMTRFGNFIKEPKETCGFDLLQIKLSKNPEGKYQAHVHTALAPLGRPTDVHLSGKGRIYVSEYSRATNSHMSYTLPGRILEMSVKR